MTNILQQHIVRVYELLLLGLLSYTVGIFVNYYYMSVLLLLTGLFGLIGVLIHSGLQTTSFRNNQRFRYMSLIGFLTGLTSAAIFWSPYVDSSVVASALMMTFIMVSTSTIMIRHVNTTSLGLFLSSTLTTLITFGILNIFFRFGDMFQILYSFVGVILFGLFITYDTKTMIERLQNNVFPDYLSECVSLFLDIMNVFIHFVKLLSQFKKIANK